MRVCVCTCVNSYNRTKECMHGRISVHTVVVRQWENGMRCMVACCGPTHPSYLLITFTTCTTRYGLGTKQHTTSVM